MSQGNIHWKGDVKTEDEEQPPPPPARKRRMSVSKNHLKSSSSSKKNFNLKPMTMSVYVMVKQFTTKLQSRVNIRREMVSLEVLQLPLFRCSY